MPWRYVNIFIEPNPNCPDGCSQRFTTGEAPRAVRSVRYAAPPDRSVVCDVTGWSSEGGGSPCPAHAVPVEDSGAGIAMLVYGGDWGLRLTPRDGTAPFGEPYLLLAGDALIDPEGGGEPVDA
jgi:hypothetical protein